MHELPKDLTNSLRSYRGSIYGDNRRSAENGRPDDRDVEKGLEDHRDKLGTLSTKESSLILVLLYPPSTCEVRRTTSLPSGYEWPC